METSVTGKTHAGKRIVGPKGKVKSVRTEKTPRIKPVPTAMAPCPTRRPEDSRPMLCGSGWLGTELGNDST